MPGVCSDAGKRGWRGTGDTGGRARGFEAMRSGRTRAMARRRASRRRWTQDTSVCDSVISVAPARACRLTQRRALLAGTALVCASLALATGAQAQTSWTDATGSWFVPGNWSNGVPPNGSPTTVGNGGTAQINAAANAGSALVIGGGSTVELQSGGSLTATTTTINST